MFKLGAKRRRTKAEIDEAREEERLRQEGEDQKLQQIAALQARLAQVEAEKANGDAATELLNQWRDEGRLRQGDDGSVQIVEESERQAMANAGHAHPGGSQFLQRPVLHDGLQ